MGKIPLSTNQLSNRIIGIFRCRQLAQGSAMGRAKSYLGGHTVITQGRAAFERRLEADAVKARRRAALEQKRFDEERIAKRQKAAKLRAAEEALDKKWLEHRRAESEQVRRAKERKEVAPHVIKREVIVVKRHPGDNPRALARRRKRD
jgi:hypothetical protein